MRLPWAQKWPPAAAGGLFVEIWRRFFPRKITKGRSLVRTREKAKLCGSNQHLGGPNSPRQTLFTTDEIVYRTRSGLEPPGTVVLREKEGEQGRGGVEGKLLRQKALNGTSTRRGRGHVFLLLLPSFGHLHVSQSPLTRARTSIPRSQSVLSQPLSLALIRG